MYLSSSSTRDRVVYAAMRLEKNLAFFIFLRSLGWNQFMTGNGSRNNEDLTTRTRAYRRAHASN